MGFQNRDIAAIQLAEVLEDLSKDNPLLLAIPRGAVPMTRLIRDRIGGDLDIILVHKFGYPDQPEYALGAVTEEGEVILGMGAQRMGLNTNDVSEAALSEIRKLKEKRRLFTPERPTPLDPSGRTVIVVDDGIATGATMTAAVRSLHHKGASRIVVATPVASPEAVRILQGEGAEVRSLMVPEYFYSVSQFYDEFEQISDEEAIAALHALDEDQGPIGPVIP